MTAIARCVRVLVFGVVWLLSCCFELDLQALEASNFSGPFESLAGKADTSSPSGCNPALTNCGGLGAQATRSAAKPFCKLRRELNVRGCHNSRLPRSPLPSICHLTRASCVKVYCSSSAEDAELRGATQGSLQTWKQRRRDG